MITTWQDLKEEILNLKSEIRFQLSRDKNRYDSDLRESREEVDRLIRNFLEANLKDLLDIDPLLYFNDFQGVYTIREFETQRTREFINYHLIGKFNSSIKENFSLEKVAVMLGDLKQNLQANLNGLKPYWLRLEATGRAQDLSPNRRDLEAFEIASEAIKKELSRLDWLGILAIELNELRDSWLDLSNEAAWLTRISKKEENV